MSDCYSYRARCVIELSFNTKCAVCDKNGIQKDMKSINFFEIFFFLKSYILELKPNDL